jgi:hypothetical protein
MYKEIEPLIDNTVCEAREIDGKIVSYRIRPIEGYQLHEVTLDENVIDENGIETGKIRKGFTESYITAGADYDFEKNEREIYAITDRRCSEYRN